MSWGGWDFDSARCLDFRIVPDKFYKRKSQEKHFALRRRISDFPACLIERGCFLLSAPWTRYVAQPITAVWIFSVSGFHRVSSRCQSTLRPTSKTVVRCQPWFYLRLMAYRCFGLSERA